METIELMCSDATPTLFGLFDPSVAPGLLYYAYIPAIIIVGFISIGLLFRDKFSKKSLSFFSVGLFFCLWVINEMIQWIAVYHATIALSWRFSLILEGLVFISVIWAITTHFPKSKLLRQLTLAQIIIPITSLLVFSSRLNLQSYDMINCEGVPGIIWPIFYTYQLIIILFVWWYGKRLSQCELDENTCIAKGRVVTAFSFLLITFLGTLFFSDITGWYQANLIIPLMMILSLEYIGFTAVAYPIFSFKLYRSEILIYTTIALMGSLLFIPDVTDKKIVITLSMIALIILGNFILKISKREEVQRFELQEANKKLTQLDATKNEFLSFATHQLRSPLTSFKWGLGTVAEATQSDAPTHAIVQQLRNTADDMISTVNDLLDISKIEQGGLVMNTEPIDLVEFLDRISEEYRASALAKNLTLNFIPKIPLATVSGDRTKLRQVFGNIIDNAIKYTPSGTITINLTHSDTYYLIAITDTGSGISQEELAKLFIKFGRGTAGKASSSGSGLGLYLAKKIVELHHGTIEITSPGIGNGSTFTVNLPELKN